MSHSVGIVEMERHEAQAVRHPFPAPARFADFDHDFWPLYDRVKPFTMTTPERLYDLYQSIRYVNEAQIPGALVECGVWRGGSSMLMALGQMKYDTIRPLQLFDTFEGLPEPDADLDVDLIGGPASDRWREGWIKVDLDEVKANLRGTGYNPAHLEFIKGMVEETLRDSLLPQYAIARLDTDWYASTKCELELLWPRIAPGGFLIIDDYGHWMGARKAVDKFFAGTPVKMSRVDYSCRSIQKI